MRRIKSAPANIAAMAHNEKPNLSKRRNCKDTSEIICSLAVTYSSEPEPTTCATPIQISVPIPKKGIRDDAMSEIVCSLATDANVSDSTEQLALTLLIQYMVSEKCQIDVTTLIRDIFYKLITSFVTHHLMLVTISLFHASTTKSDISLLLLPPFRN